MDGVKRAGLSEAAAGTALLVLGAACAGLLMSQDRHLVPLHMPGLTLPAGPVAARMADDRARSGGELSERAAKLDALLLEQGRIEHEGTEESRSYARRRKQLSQGYVALVTTEGEDTALRLRARATARFEDALDLKLPAGQAAAVIGAMSSVFQREGVAHEGRLLAPRFVVRTLFKARWNILHGRAPDHAFERIEKRAFYGWQALHADLQAIERRIAALKPFAEAGGEHVDEAMGTLLFQARNYAASAAALEAAYKKRPSIRLRNYLLGARWAAGFVD